MVDQSTKPTRRYPSLPDPGSDLKSHSDFLRAVRSAMQTHERRDRDILNSFVRLGELIDLGILKLEGNSIVLGDEVGGSSDSETGLTLHSALPRGATWVISSGEIVTPVNDVPLYIPNAATILGVTLLTLGGPGDCVVDIWKNEFANYPPDVYDSICPTNKPEISSGVSFRDATLTNWDVDLAAGDTLHFHLESSSTFSLIYAALDIRENA